MTLEETIDALIEDFDGWQEYNSEKRLRCAHAILAAIRTHMTSPEAVERAAAAYWSDGDLVADIGDVLKKAILAALGEPPAPTPKGE